MATTREPLSDELHKLSNYLECRLPDLFRELLIDGRTDAAAEIAWKGCNFVEMLRAARDGREGEK
jgi:hypothetical protein